jgi:hypothetical protein
VLGKQPTRSFPDEVARPLTEGHKRSRDQVGELKQPADFVAHLVATLAKKPGVDRRSLRQVDREQRSFDEIRLRQRHGDRYSAFGGKRLDRSLMSVPRGRVGDLKQRLPYKTKTEPFQADLGSGLQARSEWFEQPLWGRGDITAVMTDKDGQQEAKIVDASRQWPRGIQ